MNVKVKKPLENLDFPHNHIDEKEYLAEYGSTRISIQFWKMIKNRIGKITHAKMTYKNELNYKFYLRTENEAVIEFHGFAGGYGGTGPSGCYEVLVDAGFDKEQAKVVFEKEEFFIAKETE